MAGKALTIGVAGATGAVGRELMALLERAPFPVGNLVPMASSKGRIHTMEFNGQHLTVANLTPGALDGLDLLFLAIPRQVGEKVIPVASRLGCAIVDFSGAVGPAVGVPWVVPRLNRVALQACREKRIVASPAPLAVALGTLLAPIFRALGPMPVRTMAFHSASMCGRGGAEELSRQVVSLFNGKEPPRHHFPGGLAFDLIPAIGPLDDQGWSQHERDVATQVATLVGGASANLVCTTMVAPWFTSLALQVHVDADRRVERDEVEAWLGEDQQIEMTVAGDLEDIPRPRSVSEDSFLHVGRIRADPLGRGFHVWAVADEVRFGAAANGIDLAQALVEEGIL